MSFSEIAFKMFKANVKKYKLFILCNLASIAVLYSFISISLDKKFMNHSVVDAMISGNIYAPIFFQVAFMVIFIPYSQSVFMKSRERDYGILLSLGMTENEVKKSVLIENLVLYIVSLISGLILGTVLSIFFLAFIHNVIGISSINVTVNFLSYKVTTIYVVSIFVISFIVNFCIMIKSTIYDKIKSSEKAERGSHSSIILSCIGIVITILSFVVMVIFYSRNKNIRLPSLLFCIIGSLLIFFNGEVLIEYFQNKNYKKYIKRIFLFSDIKYYYGKNKKILFANTWIFFVLLFFIELSIVGYSNIINNSITYHPFHMICAEIKDDFKPLPENEIVNIAHKYNNNITKKETVKFVRNKVFTIFSVDDVNRVLKRNYKVQSKSYIYLHPYDRNDGYEHEDINSNPSSIRIKSKEGTKRFAIQKTVVDPLLGQINAVSSNIVLVNKEDYKWIRLKGIDYFVKGKLHLYNFSNWRDSNTIVNDISKKLYKSNNIRRSDRFFETSSRIKAYDTALKSSNFLTFLLIYVCIFLYCSTIITIHFKLQMEYEDETKKCFSLHRIGIEKIEIKKMVFQKILMIYVVPLVYAVIINSLYISYIFNPKTYGSIGIIGAIITSLILLLIQLIVCKLYSNVYYKKIIFELDLN